MRGGTTCVCLRAVVYRQYVAKGPKWRQGQAIRGGGDVEEGVTFVVSSLHSFPLLHYPAGAGMKAPAHMGTWLGCAPALGKAKLK